MEIVCPKCGGNNWVAEYMASVRQPCDIICRDDFGKLVINYTDAATIVEEQENEGDIVRCRDCDYSISASDGMPEYEHDPEVVFVKEV